MKRIILTALIAVIILVSHAQTLETDSLLCTVKEELQYTMEQLKKKPVPAYFMSIRLVDKRNLTITSEFGASTLDEQHQRYIVPYIRLGNKELDNYKYVNQGNANPKDRNAEGEMVPFAGNTLPALRDEIWTATMNRYDIALTNYEYAVSNTKTTAELEDKAPCFSDSPVETFYEPALPDWKTDTTTWISRLNKVTNVFKQCRFLVGGEATLTFITTRKNYVNTDGTIVAHNRRCLRLVLTAMLNATDGMPCSLSQDFFGFSESEIPGDSVIIATANDMVERLLALREAPLADPYSGPAILSGSASGVFFHEIFGHRLESCRMKTGGQTFKHMIGQQVLPVTFNVTCDPTMQYYGKQALNGYYKFDDEGVKAQRVVNVENGILKNFLMGRIPVDGFPQSNGHGRASGGNDPLSRQSNLVVETAKHYTDAQLRQMLIKEAKKQGKEYGYFFRTVSNGYTRTEEINSFNIVPQEVYRIYVDGRKDELVRGVSLIGTPLNMFSNIVAGGDTPETFIGVCGAESGWIPVTATSPDIFVSKIETQRNNTSKMASYIIPLPPYAQDPNMNNVDGADEQEVIFKALEDEMQRTRDSVQIEGAPLPYFVDYRVVSGSYFTASASLGGLYVCSYVPNYHEGYVNLNLGDKMFTDQFSLDSKGTDVNLMGQLDYDDMRRGFWLVSDYMYKRALKDYGQKVDYVKKNPLPEEDMDIPEVIEMPAREYIEPTALTETIDTALARKITTELSSVFVKYPKIFDSDAYIMIHNYDVYRITSEGLRLRIPASDLMLKIDALIKAYDGEDLMDALQYNVGKLSELPSLAQMMKDVDDFCQLMVKKSEAPAVQEYYVGPILIEDEAISDAIIDDVVLKNCRAEREMASGSSLSSMKLGKRILDTKISISQITDTPEYDGVKLVSDYRVDADGITPVKSMPIVENGILKNLITGRNPAVNALQSTGNDRFLPYSYLSFNIPGTLHITIDKGIPMSKIKDAFISEAKKANLDYAYIIKSPCNCSKYLVRVNVMTGKEEIVRVQNIPEISRSDMMHVVASSKEECINNTLEIEQDMEYLDGRKYTVSVIAPKAILLENVEFSLKKPDRSSDLELENPACRAIGY